MTAPRLSHLHLAQVAVSAPAHSPSSILNPSLPRRRQAVGECNIGNPISAFPQPSSHTLPRTQLSPSDSPTPPHPVTNPPQVLQPFAFLQQSQTQMSEVTSAGVSWFPDPAAAWPKVRISQLHPPILAHLFRTVTAELVYQPSRPKSLPAHLFSLSHTRPSPTQIPPPNPNPHPNPKVNHPPSS